MSKSILITGATGKQGGALIRALIASGADINIVAVTRNPSSDSAKALAQQSSKITVVQGDLDNSDAIFKAAEAATSQPVWGVFALTLPMGPSASPDTEEVQGKALVDAALAAKTVKHFVYASVDRGVRSATNPTNVPHFASKYNVEQHLIAATKGSGMTWTVLQPVAFTDNFGPAGSQFAAAFAAMWKAYLGVDKKLQIITTTDIGKAGTAAFLEPEKYAGRMIQLAGDDITFSQLEKVFREKTGKDIPAAPEEVARGIVEGNDDLKAMWTWFVTDSFGADVAALRKEFPGLMDFGAWLEKESGYETQ